MNRRLLPIVFSLAATLAGVAHADGNLITVVIGNGPFAGTYHTDNTVGCLRVKAQDLFGAGWKDFKARGEKAFAEAGVGAYAPDLPGAKKGRAEVSFGEDPKIVKYDFSRVPVTLEIKGKGGVIRFDGKTPEGIKVHIEAVCTEVENF